MANPTKGIGRINNSLVYIKYSEIFHSIQGEGMFTGMPSVFFRTSYCNLKCDWCDTPYTSHQPENKDISIDQVVSDICNFGCDYVVITGGEPFVQKKKLKLLCQELHDRGKHITIETNGTIYHPVIADLISCSPKTSNSKPSLELVNEREQQKHEDSRINSQILRSFIEAYDHQFKFVVAKPEDFVEIEEIIYITGIEPDNVFLMPEGRTTQEILQKEYWLVEKCIKLGYRYSDRLHVRLWNDRRGV